MAGFSLCLTYIKYFNIQLDDKIDYIVSGERGGDGKGDGFTKRGGNFVNFLLGMGQHSGKKSLPVEQMHVFKGSSILKKIHEQKSKHGGKKIFQMYPFSLSKMF